MPLPFFGSKFSVKKSTPRKATSLSALNVKPLNKKDDFNASLENLRLSVGDLQATFKEAEGNWVPETGDFNQKYMHELRHLRAENVALRESNNLLQVKVELLLNMLTETTLQAQ